MTDQIVTDLLAINQNFQTQSGTYTVQQKLGSGLTSEVYKARGADGTEVAIKVMRPTASAMDRKAFISEAMTLARMQELEKNAGDGLFVAPRFYGADESASPPYIVQELISGKQLPDLLAATPRLPEADALTIAAQLFRTLHLLHTGLNLTYIDLKLENLWWNPAKRALKMTDWGTLSALDPVGVARDLLRGSQYLYRILTGKTITETRGIPLQRPDDFPEWKEISWGLREMLQRMLHRDPGVRYQSADQIKAAIHEIQSYWNMPPSELVDLSRRMITRAEAFSTDQDIEKKAAVFHSARTALDICALLPGGNSPETQRLMGLAEKGVTDTDYFSRAKALYDGMSYGKARKLFEDGARLYYDANLRRWALLCEAGDLEPKERFEPVKGDAEGAIGSMGKEEYKQALQILETVVTRLPSSSLVALRDECKVFIHINNAREKLKEGAYPAASKEYQDGYDLWKRIPQNAAWQYMVGDLRHEAHKMQIMEDTRGVALRAMQAAKTGVDLDAILEHLWQAVISDPGNLEIYREIFDLAQVQHNAGRSRWAAQILRLGSEGPSAPQLTAGWGAPGMVLEALESGPLTLAGLALGQIPDAPSFLRDITRSFVSEHAAAALAAGDIERAEALHHLAQRLDPQWAEAELAGKIQQKHQENRERRQRNAERLLDEAKERLSLDRPDAILAAAQALPLSAVISRLGHHISELKWIRQALNTASNLAGEDHPRKKEIDELYQYVIKLQNRVESQLKEKHAQKEPVQTACKERVESSLTRLAQVEAAAQGLRKAGLPENVQDHLVSHRISLLINALQACQQVRLEIDPEDDWAIRQEQQILQQIDALGKPAWKELAAYTSLGLGSPEPALKEAGEKYTEGRTADAAQILSRLEESFISMKKKVALALGIAQWEADNAAALTDGAYNAELLRGIGEHLKLNLPTAYWKDSLSLKYLTMVCDSLSSEVSKIEQPDTEPDHFVECLRRLVWGCSLQRQANAAALGNTVQPATGWDAFSFLRQARKIHRAGAGGGTRLEQILKELPILSGPEQQSNALNPDMMAMAQREDQTGADEAHRRKKVAVNLVLVIFLLVILGALSILGWQNRDRIRDFLAGGAPSTPVQVTTTQPPILPTSTLAPTLTNTPTETTLPPTPTEIPTLIPTETPLPSSVFTVSDITTISPTITGPVESAILLGDISITTSMPLTDTAYWMSCSAQGFSEPNDFYYTDQAGWITWTMDVPLPLGRYEIYVIDPLQCSGGSLDFRVLLDGVAATPILGSPRVEYLGGLNAWPQQEELWRSIGVYQLDQSALLSVTTVWENRSEQTPVAVGRLLVVSLPESANPMIDTLPLGSPAFILDDLTASLSPSEGWQVTSDSPAWSNQFQYIVNPQEEVVVTWQVPVKLPAGKYVILVWVPATHASASALFTLLVDGQPLDTFRDMTLDQAQWAGKDQWTQIHVEFDVPDTGQPVTLALQMIVTAGTSGEVAVDAVAIVKKP